MTEETVRFGAKWREVARPQPLSQGAGDSLENDIVLTESQRSLVLSVNEQEFSKLLSSALNGANIYFPDEYLSIIYPLIKAGKMALCEEIANCIETSQAVKDALANNAGGAGGAGGSGGSLGGGVDAKIPSNVDSSNLISGSDCSDDNLFGIAVSLTNYSFQSIIDVLEQIDFSTSIQELYSEIADNIPAFGALPFNLLIEYGGWIQDTAYAGFLSFDTQARRDEIACDLYCIMKDNGCEISFDDITAYFFSKTAQVAFDTSFSAIVPQLIGQTADDVIGFAMLGTLYGVASIGSRFGNIANAGQIMAAMQDMLNDTDPDWATKCDPCASSSWCYELDLSGGATYENLTISSGRGFYSGSGIEAQFALSYWRIIFDVDVTGSTQITEISVTPNNIQNPDGIMNLLVFDGVTQKSSEIFNAPITTIRTTNPNVGGTRVSCQIRSSQNLTVQFIRIAGTGTNPFTIDNC